MPILCMVEVIIRLAMAAVVFDSHTLAHVGTFARMDMIVSALLRPASFVIARKVAPPMPLSWPAPPLCVLWL